MFGTELRLKAILISPKACYVCNKNITNGEEIYIGQGNYRHTYCAPGSARWLSSQQFPNSPYRDLWDVVIIDSLQTRKLSHLGLSEGLNKKMKHLRLDPRQLTLF